MLFLGAEISSYFLTLFTVYPFIMCILVFLILHFVFFFTYCYMCRCLASRLFCKVAVDRINLFCLLCPYLGLE